MVVFINGFFNAICFYSCLGICGKFDVKYIVNFSVGQALAGIVTNILTYVCTLSLNKNEKVSIFLNFGITALILIIALILFIKTTKTEYYQSIMLKSLTDKLEVMPIPDSEADSEKLGMEEGPDQQLIESDSEASVSKGRAFFNLLQEILVTVIMAVYCYIITFTVYPNGAQTPQFFNFSNERWKSVKFNTVATIYNIFDTVGRKITDFVPLTKFSCNFHTLIRTIFLVTFPLNLLVSQKGLYTGSGIFLIFNVSLLALTNGLSISLCFALAPHLVEGKKKGRAASCIGFFSVLGIVLGSVTAFGMNAIFKVIQDKVKVVKYFPL